jgi:hypothetical protein
VEGGDCQGELSVLFLECNLQLEVLELALLGSNVSDDIFGGKLNVKDGEAFSIVEMNLNIIEADVRALRYFIIRLEVGLKVVFGGSDLDLGGVFEDEGVLLGDVEEEGGILERLALELSLDIGVDEGGDAGKLHLK